MPNSSGGCLCGRVRYTATGEPAFSGLCHCRDCQRYTGSAFETIMAFPSASVSVQGELRTYDGMDASGRPVHRCFCPNCGSGVIAEADIRPGLTFVLAGTLDDPGAFEPGMDVYWSSAQPWLHAGRARAQYPKMPALPQNLPQGAPPPGAKPLNAAPPQRGKTALLSGMGGLSVFKLALTVSMA